MSRFFVVSTCALMLVAGFVWTEATSPRPVSAATITIANDLELRALPAADAAVVTVIPAGASLSLDGPPQNDFYPVSYDGVSGWLPGAALIISKDEVTVADEVVPEIVSGEATVPPEEGDQLTLPASVVATAIPASDEATTEPTASVETAATMIPTAEVTETPAEDLSPEPTMEVSPEPTLPPSPPADAPTVAPTRVPTVRGPATATTDMSLLAGPEWGNDVLFSVPAGSTMTRTGSYVNGFVSANFMGIDGWLDASSLAEPLPAEPEATAALAPTAAPATSTPVLPTVTPTEPPAVGGPGSGTAYPGSDLSLRSGPSASYDLLTTIPAGEPVALTGVMENGFVRVQYEGQIGWVAIDRLSMPADPTPATSPRGTEARRVYSREEIIQVIYDAADRYRQPRADMLRVAECESNLDPYAVNPSGSYGLFQFVTSTWNSTPYADRDIFDPRANANAAAWMWSVGRRAEWVCR